MEFFDALGGNPPLVQVFPSGFGLGRLQQAVVILFFGPVHRPKTSSAAALRLDVKHLVSYGEQPMSAARDMT